MPATRPSRTPRPSRSSFSSSMPRVARALAVAPVLFTLAYATCGHRTGFTLALEVVGVRFAASTCAA